MDNQQGSGPETRKRGQFRFSISEREALARRAGISERTIRRYLTGGKLKPRGLARLERAILDLASHIAAPPVQGSGTAPSVDGGAG